MMHPGELTFHQYLHHITWPEHAVFIADRSLPASFFDGLQSPPIFVDAGESLKTLQRVGALAEAILDRRSTRPLTLVAIGGGSIGDAVGFLASILWRGVSLWHVPTTLLAMVDSAHGGKTALNLGGRKNQLGTFYPAERTLICEEILHELPLDLREEGLVELLKALWLGAPDALATFDDPDAYHRILTKPIASEGTTWQELLKRAVAVKTDVVSQDPEERSGLRRILNLGHTGGHALEALLGLRHGRAVAWGLAACGILSQEFSGLSEASLQRLFSHLDPLLIPLPHRLGEDDQRQFEHLIGRDKKQEKGRLVSILLKAPGHPVQTTEITPAHWWQALRKAQKIWREQTLFLSADSLTTAPQPSPPRLPADKSRANRAAIIAHLRPGPTEIELPDGLAPDDVLELRRALRRLSQSSDSTLHTGLGATSARFLIALAAASPVTTHLICPPALMRRPHTPLITALTRGGATIEATRDGFTIKGWPTPPKSLHVDATKSSQFASALALLAASGHPLTLHIQGPIASRPYFDMTLAMLRQAGIEITETSEHHLIFTPTPQLQRPLRFQIPQDTSSAVVWQALSSLQPSHFAPIALAANDAHPDRRFLSIAQALTAPGTDALSVDLGPSPDLAPVLAALAAQSPRQVRVHGAAQLRYKESNRIDGLIESFAAVGVFLEATDDGFIVPAGRQTAQAGALFDPRDDHRLTMAALVLSLGASQLRIKGARCVTKSYPDLFRQVRRAGFHVTCSTDIAASSSKS